MKRIHYRDFKIAFLSKRGKAYILTVEAPGGKGRSEMKLDFDEMLGTWVELGESVRRGRPSGPATEVPLTPVERVGESLFESLFTGKVKELWAYSLGQQYEKTLTEMTGLRVKLEMDPDVPEMAQLMSLPWEFLYRADERRFLCLDPSTPLVRYLNVPQPIAPYKFTPPLRILMVISRATSDANKYTPLDLATERKRIDEAWANVPNVEVDFLPQATLTALRPKFLQRDYHVLHFMGHGDFDLNEGKGVLLFEDDSGDAHPINGRDLADQLIGKQSLRLVFLNACESARMSDAPGHDPFAGTAAALVMSGIPAVIAMQYPISDRAAITFASAFYTNLAGGMPVDQAATEGRLAVRGKFRNQMEWGTPVLFMRTDDGQLFDVGAASPPAPLGISNTTVAAIRDCFHESQSAIVAAVPIPQQAESILWLKRALDSVLMLNAESVVTLRAALSHFQTWPAAFALFQDLLQEPLLQRRARTAGESLAKEYEHVIFK